MGSDAASDSLCSLPGVTRDAQPIHRVYVDGFWMDATEVTNEQFDRFVDATGYVTIAERTPTKEEFPTAPPENLVAGSTVFTPTAQPVPLDDHYRWWRYEKGANWRHPEGPSSSITGPRAVSGRAHRLRRRRGVREVGGQAAADRSGMGVRGARRRLPASSMPGATTCGPAASWTANIYQGQFPDARRRRGRLRRHRAGGAASRRTATASTTSPATSGSGAATGIAPTTYAQLAAAGGVARNPQGPDSPSIRPSRTRRSASTAAARSSAPTSTARATWSARAAKARSRPAATISASGSSKPWPRPSPSGDASAPAIPRTTTPHAISSFVHSFDPRDHADRLPRAAGLRRADGRPGAGKDHPREGRPRGGQDAGGQCAR